MKSKYERCIKPSELTQELINKIEDSYLKSAYGNNIEKYTWNRPVGTTINVDDILLDLKKQLNKEIEMFKDFEFKLYKEQNGEEPNLEELYKELMHDELTINNKKLDFHSNPCYGAYVEGMDFADIHLKIKFIVSNGGFYVYLENSEWGGRGTELPKKVLKKWNDMIANLYYNWFVNDIPVYIPYPYRTKVKKLMNG